MNRVFGSGRISILGRGHRTNPGQTQDTSNRMEDYTENNTKGVRGGLVNCGATQLGATPITPSHLPFKVTKPRGARTLTISAAESHSLLDTPLHITRPLTPADSLH
jgi:hypothetical protein